MTLHLGSRKLLQKRLGYRQKIQFICTYVEGCMHTHVSQLFSTTSYSLQPSNWLEHQPVAPGIHLPLIMVKPEELPQCWTWFSPAEPHPFHWDLFIASKFINTSWDNALSKQGVRYLREVASAGYVWAGIHAAQLWPQLGQWWRAGGKKVQNR
jgi:hypothetical protein